MFPAYHDAAERMILGGAIRDDKYRKEAQERLPLDLFGDQNRVVWWTLREMDERREPVDHLTVTTRLTETGKFGGENVGKFVGDLMLGNFMGFEGFPVSLSGAEKLLWEASHRREYRGLAEHLHRAADENDPPDQVWSEVRSRARTAARPVLPEPVSLLALGGTVLRSLTETHAAHREGRGGIRYGFAVTDQRTGGQHPGDLVGLSAFTSQGKSALALQIAWEAAARGPALLCSNEMRSVDYVYRVFSRLTHIPYFELRTRGASEERAADMVTKLGQPLDEHPNLYFAENVQQVETFRAQLDRVTELAKQPVGWACLDWLQLMHEPRKRFESRTKEMEWIVSSMKQTAIEFNIPVLLVAQYNRASRGMGSEPMVRDTSQFEFASDVWLQIESDDRGESADARRQTRARDGGWRVNLVGRKNRHGVGEWEEPLWFDAQHAEFRPPQKKEEGEPGWRTIRSPA